MFYIENKFEKIYKSLNLLEKYISHEKFRGYDPYDTLLSPIPFLKLGKWIPIIAIQIQKRNPINIRSLLRIKKDYNSKAMGLLLNGYSLLYNKTKDESYKLKADFIYTWLKNNFTVGYSGHCWGYNFPWANPSEFVPAYIPTSVATSIICRGLWRYYLTTKDNEIKDIIVSSAKFITNDLNKYEDKTGICLSYSPISYDCCYNASLLSGEVLARAYYLTKSKELFDICLKIVNFVVSRQLSDGKWNYSLDLKSGTERIQLDFHQGYILESLFEIKNLLGYTDKSWEDALIKGVNFYFEKQFLPIGISYWRYPKRYPIDIHNQSQGIITFKKLRAYNPYYEKFALKIADWTIDNMQTEEGYFIYRKNRFYDIKIPYMRWSQAWMFLALAELICN